MGLLLFTYLLLYCLNFFLRVNIGCTTSNPINITFKRKKIGVQYEAVWGSQIPGCVRLRLWPTEL